MISRRSKIAAVGSVAILCGFLLISYGCGAAGPQGSTSTAQGSTSTILSLTTSTSVAGAEGPAQSLAETWAASVAAVEGLDPVRVSIVQTTEGRVLNGPTTSTGVDSGPRSTKAEQLIDRPAGRARLTVYGSDHSVQTTVLDGSQEITLTGGPGTMTTGLVTYSRYVFLEPPTGLPLALWAGTQQSYTGIRARAPVASSGGEWVESAGLVEQVETGGRRLSWVLTTKTGKITYAVTLDQGLLPVRVEQHFQGEATGDLEGLTVDSSSSIEYRFQKLVSLPASDFALDAPQAYWRRGVTYELSTKLPWSNHADWGQYWLGGQVGDWVLVKAEQAGYEDNPNLAGGAEPTDEHVSLIYDRPGTESDNENIQMMVRPLRGRIVEDSRTFAEQRVAAGDWTRREMTVAGQSATVYGAARDGGTTNRADSISIYLPDSFVQIQLWAPVDPQVVLEALRRVR